jgi:hypothetical protein
VTFACFLQVRSVTLDEKVWERSVVALFEGLGNAYANAAWEENIAAPHNPPPGAAAAAAAALDAATPGCGPTGLVVSVCRHRALHHVPCWRS